MKIIISCHCDTVFRIPHLRWRDGVLRGALDNFGSILACALIIQSMGPEIIIEFTEDEELTMDGARSLAKSYSNQDTLFIVMDVTAGARGSHFTIENTHRVRMKDIKKALSPLKGKYRFVNNGTESEAWLYKDMGFAVIEVDLPVKGGLHSLDGYADFENVKLVAQAVELLVRYFKDKTITEIEDTPTA
jgi:hypothetical protein